MYSIAVAGVHTKQISPFPGLLLAVSLEVLTLSPASLMPATWLLLRRLGLTILVFTLLLWQCLCLLYRREAQPSLLLLVLLGG